MSRTTVIITTGSCIHSLKLIEMEAPFYKLCRYHLLALMCIGNIVALMLRFTTSVTVLAMENVSTLDMAQVESAFYYGYCIGTAPMGFVADAVGARLLIALAIGGSGVFALFTEVAANNGLAWLIALRFFQGLCQSAMNSPQKSLWGKWCPIGERTVFCGSYGFCLALGIMLMNLTTRKQPTSLSR